MGMYTEFNFAAKLKSDAPKEVFHALDVLVNRAVMRVEDMPDHEFFKCERWRMLAWCRSAYFDAEPHSYFGKPREWENEYTVQILCNLKNYDGEIEKFVDWITPYLDCIDGQFLGYSRYEEFTKPNLLNHPNKWTESK